jgi:hypothetical protein
MRQDTAHSGEKRKVLSRSGIKHLLKIIGTRKEKILEEQMDREYRSNIMPPAFFLN